MKRKSKSDRSSVEGDRTPALSTEKDEQSLGFTSGGANGENPDQWLVDITITALIQCSKAPSRVREAFGRKIFAADIAGSVAQLKEMKLDIKGVFALFADDYYVAFKQDAKRKKNLIFFVGRFIPESLILK